MDSFFFFFFFFFGGGGGGVIMKSYYFFFILLFIYLFFFFFFLGGGGGVSFLYIIGLFKVKIQNGNIFWAANFQIFLGIPDIPVCFFVVVFLGGRGWG